MMALAAPAFHSASAAGAGLEARTVNQTQATMNRTRRAVIRILSGEHVADDSSFDVGESAVDAVVADREPFVVDAQQVQHGGVDVVASGRLVAVGRLVAPFVTGAERCA